MDSRLQLTVLPKRPDLLDASLADLVKNRVITREEAARHAEDPAKLAN